MLRRSAGWWSWAQRRDGPPGQARKVWWASAPPRPGPAPVTLAVFCPFTQVGKRRGGNKLALKTGIVAKKQKTEDEVSRPGGVCPCYLFLPWPVSFLPGMGVPDGVTHSSAVSQIT